MLGEGRRGFCKAKACTIRVGYDVILSVHMHLGVCTKAVAGTKPAIENTTDPWVGGLATKHRGSIRTTRYFSNRWTWQGRAFTHLPKCPLKRDKSWGPNLCKHPSCPETLHNQNSTSTHSSGGFHQSMPTHVGA